MNLCLGARSLRVVKPSLFAFPVATTSPFQRRHFSRLPFAASSGDKMPNKHNHKDMGAEHIQKEHAHVADEAHQFQAGNSIDRKEDEWKHREPYRIHSNDEEFPVKWTGGCHCGKVKYQLSREKPLASKFCHCTTCQRLHGVSRGKGMSMTAVNRISLHSNGRRSFTRATSTSLMAFMTSAGMTLQTNPMPITSPARCIAHFAEHPLWTKAGI